MRLSTKLQTFSCGLRFHRLHLGLGLILGFAFSLTGTPKLSGQDAAASGSNSLRAPSNASEGLTSSVELLPTTTEGFIAFSDLPALGDDWKKTSFFELRNDPAMQPFIESQREKIQTRLANMGLKIGLSIDDLCGSVSGEVVLAWLSFEAPKRPFAVALLADTTGRDQAREIMLKKIDAELRKRDAKVSTMPVQGEQVTLYTMPRQKGQLIIARFAVVTVNGRLIISDQPDTLAGLVSAAKNGQPQSLVSTAEYRKLFTEVQQSHQHSDPIAADKPRVRWYARPIQMGMIARQLAEVDRGNKVDILKLLRNQGFNAIQAAGGEVFLSTDSYEILHQGYVLAPPTAPEPARYDLAAASLQFPNANFGELPSWVVPSAATLFRANWRMKEAFWATESLVDEAFTQKGFFRDMLRGFRNDPAGGIEIDVENDVVASLGEDFLIITENEMPEDGAAATPNAERAAAPEKDADQAAAEELRTREQVVLAIRITDVEAISRVINKQLSRDKDIFRVPFDAHPIWEVRPSEVYSPEGFPDDDFGFGFTDEDVVQAAPAEPLLEAWAFTVFDGYLMISSHSSFLIKLIQQSQTAGPTLASLPAFKRVQEVIAKEADNKAWSMERVILTERAWRIKYYLIRQGKFIDSDSLLATILRRLKESAEKAAPNKPEEPLDIDTSTLPPFEQIRKYLNPGGGFVQTTDQGWAITQFLLK